MSIRSRLLVIVFLAGIAATAAVLAIFHLASTREAARSEAAQSQVRGVAQALVDAYESRPEGTSVASQSPDLRRYLQRETAAMLAPLPKAIGGYCLAAGPILIQGRAGRPDPKKPFLNAEQAATVERDCQRGPGDYLETLKTRDIVAISIVKLDGDDGGLAFAALVVGKKSDEPTVWQVEFLVLALATLLLVGVSLDAAFALRRGAGELDEALARLGEDLHADVKVPRAEELARIAEGLQRMAKNLAEAHAREQTLAHQLGHEQRLAGLGRVVAGVAHEIRNPLAGMKLRLDLMVRGAADEAQKQDVRACLEEVERLDRVVRSLLVVARKDTPTTRDLELGGLIDERLGLARELAGPKDVRLVRRGSASLESDPDSLARVIDNLVRNAIEASPNGGVVTAIARMADDGMTIVEVRDEGHGIPDGRVEEMFEPFFTTKPEGTGLGLWLSRSLVDRLRGTLVYAREEGATVFRVTLGGPSRPSRQSSGSGVTLEPQ